MTSTAYESADLILRLYDLRREPTLRAAREWFFFSFHPRSADDVFRMWVGADSARYRMVTTYWEMAAALVRRGAIDEAMFHAANTEYVALIAKLGPFLPELRQRSGLADYLAEVEALVRSMPDADTRLAVLERYLARKAGKREAATLASTRAEGPAE